MSSDDLRRLWLEACAPYMVRDAEGNPKMEQMDDGRQEPIIEQGRMSSDLTIFVIQQKLNNRRPITIGNLQYWRRIGRVTSRIADTIQSWVESRE